MGTNHRPLRPPVEKYVSCEKSKIKVLVCNGFVKTSIFSALAGHFKPLFCMKIIDTNWVSSMGLHLKHPLVN